MEASCPDDAKFLQRAVLKLDIPPRKGYPGPIQMIFKRIGLIVHLSGKHSGLMNFWIPIPPGIL